MKAIAMRLLWRTILRLHLPTWIFLVRCNGYRPAVGTASYRAQYCVRFFFHRGLCLATIDRFGRPTPRGSHFNPTNLY